MLKSHGHLSVLEHSNIVLKIESERPGGDPQMTDSFGHILKTLKGRLPLPAMAARPTLTA